MNEPSSYKQHWAKWIAVGGGSGLAPHAPGTFGTLAAIPLYIALSALPLGGYLFGTIVVTLIGIWASQIYSDTLGVHDHGSIVIDEIAGYLVTMALVPFDWLLIFVGFLLFRLFDIWKPWPIHILDSKVHGGLGIMLDDLLAGIFAALVLYTLAHNMDLVSV